MIATLKIANQHTVFANRAEAEKVVATLEGSPCEIREDPNGTGKCLIALFDEDEPTEFLMYL